MLTKKRVRRNSKRSKKFLLVGGASRGDIIKDMAERLNIFKECDDKCTNLATTIYKEFIEERIVVVDPSGEELDLSSLEQAKLNERSKNHIITYIDTHGAIDNKSGPKTVPNNTVICFLSPINETNLVFPINSGSKSINNFMAKLNIDQFKTIIKEKQNLSNLESINKDTINYYNIKYKGFNCFKNSIWYYPGDKYPEVRIDVTAYDVESDITNAEDSKINTLFQPYDIEYTKRDLGGNITYTKNNKFYNELNGETIDERDKDSVRKLLLSALKKNIATFVLWIKNKYIINLFYLINL